MDRRVREDHLTDARQAERIADSADLRAVVHDEGYSAVRGFLQLGIRDAATIRRAIRYARSGQRVSVEQIIGEER